MYRYACLNNIAEVGLKRFSALYEKTGDIAAADGLLVRSANMHEMEIPDNLLAVSRAGAGVNNIPLDKMAEKGIVVFNTPGANANGVKELVIAGMLLAARDIREGIDWTRENADNPSSLKTFEKIKKNFAGTEIEGKKLGIIGIGAIGVKVANAAVYLGMDVYGYDPFVSVDAAWHLSRKTTLVRDINEIYDNCDYITIHVPLMESTKNYIGREQIKRMKKGVILLNMARDLLVDEQAVIEAIDEGKIRRYVSDFPNTTVAGHPGCITTPHLGASTEESEENCAKMAVDELTEYLETGNIRNSVNFPACDVGICTTAGRITILHHNIANMITQLSSVLGSAGVNIASMTNKSRGNYAYSVFDIDSPVTEEIVAKISAVDDVLRVRVIK
ncbi:MAG: phosphoglycerate dehydrogenase [Lachnospiraceae bacterium]|nr:phosphoglycerate dehydrogenase [Lachnospiraceae bacterium]